MAADFFLWGLLKGKVYKNTPRTIEQLKDAIHQEIQAINVDTLGKVFQNLEKCIQVCLDVKGDEFQHRLWAGLVLHHSWYVYINFQVIISITIFYRQYFGASSERFTLYNFDILKFMFLLCFVILSSLCWLFFVFLSSLLCSSCYS